MRSWRIFLLAVAFSAIVGLCVWSAFHFKAEEKKPVGMKRLSATVAEGFSYRSGREKHPRMTCRACRIRKVKMGVFSIGGMNVLEFDDLVVNMPRAEMVSEKGIRKSSGKSAASTDAKSPVEMVERFNLKSLMAMAPGVLKKSFTGLQINRFTLNRQIGDSLELVFSAEIVKNKKKSIVMQGVTICRDGKKERLASAKLEFKPRFKIVWQGGSWDITDIASDLF